MTIIDKQSGLWETSPWHVKISAWGSKSYEGIQFWMHFCAITALLSFFTIIVLMNYHYYEYIDFLFFGLALGLATYPYALALIWILKNPDVLIIK